MTEQKIDYRKNYLLAIDIETANMIDDALAYDVGFAIIDRKGNIYEEHSLMISELFINNADLLTSAYYAEKIPQYYKDFSNGKRKMVSIMTAKRMVERIMQKYHTKDVFAYNTSFDLNGLNRTLRYLTKSKYRYFFPYDTNFHCIWNMACQTILSQKSFFKFVIENDLTKENGNAPTSAEIAYRYICKDVSFTESHTGLEDVQIEAAILAKCYCQHKRMNTNIRRNCWQIPQKNFKEFAKST